MGLLDIPKKCHEESEFQKLKTKSHTRPYWIRVHRKEHLNPAERDSLSYTINKFSDLAQEGYRWKWCGDLLYSIQILTSALVPVLIGIVGSFKTIKIDAFIRIMAICLSICGTVANAIENVQNFRGRGQIRIQCADRMNTLFQMYDAQTGQFANLKSKSETLCLYMTIFEKLTFRNN